MTTQLAQAKKCVHEHDACKKMDDTVREAIASSVISAFMAADRHGANPIESGRAAVLHTAATRGHHQVTDEEATALAQACFDAPDLDEHGRPIKDARPKREDDHP